MKNLLKKLSKKIFGKTEEDILQEYLRENRNRIKVDLEMPYTRNLFIKCSDISDMKSIASHCESPQIISEFDKLNLRGTYSNYELSDLVVKDIKDSLGVEIEGKVISRGFPFHLRTRYIKVAVPQKYITLIDKKGNEVIGIAASTRPFWNNVVCTKVGDIVDTTLTNMFGYGGYAICNFKNKSIET